MQQPELPGRISFVDGGPTLDGIPIEDGQLVAAKRGEGELMLGRIRRTMPGQWILDHREFIGHTYLNIPLSGSWLNNLIVERVKNVKGDYVPE